MPDNQEINTKAPVRSGTMSFGETTQEVNAPTVGRVAPSMTAPLWGANQPIQAGIKNLQTYFKNRAADQAEADAEVDARKLIMHMNQLTEQEFGSISDEKTPEMAIQNVRSNMTMALANSKIPYKQWGTINSLLNSRVSEVGEKYYFAQKGVQYVVDATGSVHVVKKPGSDSKEDIIAQWMASIDPSEVAHIQETFGGDQEKIWNFMDNLGKFELDARQAGAQQTVTNHAQGVLNLNKSQADWTADQHKNAFDKTFMTNIRGIVAGAVIPAVQAGASPEKVLGIVRARLRSMYDDVESFSKAANRAGYKTFDDVLEAYNDTLDSVTTELKGLDQLTNDKHGLAMLNTRVGIRLATVEDKLSPYALTLLKNPNGAMYLSAVGTMQGMMEGTPEAGAFIPSPNDINTAATQIQVGELIEQNLTMKYGNGQHNAAVVETLQLGTDVLAGKQNNVMAYYFAYKAMKLQQGALLKQGYDQEVFDKADDVMKEVVRKYPSMAQFMDAKTN